MLLHGRARLPAWFGTAACSTCLLQGWPAGCLMNQGCTPERAGVLLYTWAECLSGWLPACGTGRLARRGRAAAADRSARDSREGPPGSAHHGASSSTHRPRYLSRGGRRGPADRQSGRAAASPAPGITRRPRPLRQRRPPPPRRAAAAPCQHAAPPLAAPVLRGGGLHRRDDAQQLLPVHAPPHAVRVQAHAALLVLHACGGGDRAGRGWVGMRVARMARRPGQASSAGCGRVACGACGAGARAAPPRPAPRPRAASPPGAPPCPAPPAPAQQPIGRRSASVRRLGSLSGDRPGLRSCNRCAPATGSH